MILIIGSSGYIGTEFQKEFYKQKIPFITETYKSANKENLVNIIKLNKIKYLINCAAFVGKPNIEACEKNKGETITGNVILPILLKNICEELGITFCHISTGCLYNGVSKFKDGWNELDKPNFSFEFNNCSFYTGTKVLAENEIKKYEKSYIWRIRLPFDNINNNRNYISKIINYDTLLLEENSISHKNEFVKACIDSIKLEIPYGIYNITNTGSISAKDIFEKIVKKIKPNKKATFLNEDDFYKKISSMPRSNCIIDNKKILSMGINMSEVNDSIDKALDNWIW